MLFLAGDFSPIDVPTVTVGQSIDKNLRGSAIPLTHRVERIKLPPAHAEGIREDPVITTGALRCPIQILQYELAKSIHPRPPVRPTTDMHHKFPQKERTPMRTMNFMLLTGAMLCSTSAYSLEVTGHNDLRNVNSGLEQRLEATKAALTAAHNNLRETVDTFDGRITTVETGLGAVQTKNTEQDGSLTQIRSLQPVSWNAPLENRLRAIENAVNGLGTRVTALEKNPAAGGTLIYRTTVSTSSNGNTAYQNYDVCVLTRASFSTTQDNHGHSCNMTRTADGFRLSSSQTQGSTTCTMMCYDLE